MRSSPWEDLVNYFSRRKSNWFPEGARVRALWFYGPPVMMPDGFLDNPYAIHVFESPVSEDVACALMVAVAKDGGIIGQNGFFIPWPPGAVFFEPAEPSANNPPSKEDR